MGVFAVHPIEPGELVAVWGGAIYTAAEVAALGDVFPHFRTHPFQVAEGFYMASTSNTAIDDAERFNHSCDPNIGIKGQLVVLARRGVRAGDELTFDYETTDAAPAPFRCRCGAVACRGQIDGAARQSPEFRRQHAGWLSWFLAEQAGQP
jgi:hypothetical protein